MVLLKAKEFDQETTTKKAFNLNDIAAEAKLIIEEARRRRREMLDQALKEIDQTRQQAQTLGHQQGYEKGLAQGQEEGHQQALQESRQNFAQKSEELLNTFRAACQQFDQCKHELLWQAEQNMVALALAIARKVIKQAGMLSTDVALENVKAALDMVTDKTDVVVKLSPGDIEHLKELTEKDEKMLGKYDSIRFETDQILTPGSCRVCTNQGEIDARLETQINRIADELLMAREDETEKPKN
jgi:flagellar assembly protein FliH